VVPDAEGPGRRESLRVAASGRRAAVGPNGPLSRLSRSWRLACDTLALGDREGLVVADEYLGELLLSQSAYAVERIGEQRLSALAALTPLARERMARTALAFVQQQGNAAAVARALQIHPQTARYRIARLRALLGAQLDGADARFELEAALRAFLDAGLNR
jgi:DNA-binding PucR family transcriptional regulator